MVRKALLAHAWHTTYGDNFYSHQTFWLSKTATKDLSVWPVVILNCTCLYNELVISSFTTLNVLLLSKVFQIMCPKNSQSDVNESRELTNLEH